MIRCTGSRIRCSGSVALSQSFPDLTSSVIECKGWLSLMRRIREAPGLINSFLFRWSAQCLAESVPLPFISWPLCMRLVHFFSVFFSVLSHHAHLRRSCTSCPFSPRQMNFISWQSISVLRASLMRKGAILQPWGLGLAVSGELWIVSWIFKMFNTCIAFLYVLADLDKNCHFCSWLVTCFWNYFHQHLTRLTWSERIFFSHIWCWGFGL